MAVGRILVGTEMVAAADWVAVYRILVDKCGAPSSHTAFAEFINALDMGEYPPCSRDLLRKADAVYMRPIYEGKVDYDAYINTLKTVGCEYALVEQDYCYDESPFECLRRSYENVTARFPDMK